MQVVMRKTEMSLTHSGRSLESVHVPKKLYFWECAQKLFSSKVQRLNKKLNLSPSH